jgi:transcription termination factor 2
VALALCRLEARHRWVVTGTPIHNKPEDFFSLTKFLRASPFDDAFCWKYWIGLKSVPAVNLGRLHTLGKAVILRRTKLEVADTGLAQIPPKTVIDVVLELNPEEEKIYQHLEDFAKQQFKTWESNKKNAEDNKQRAADQYVAKGKGKKGNNDGGCGDLDERNSDPVKFSHIYVLLMRLRQFVVLPFLIKVMLEGEGVDEEESIEEVSYDAEFDPVNSKNPVFCVGYKSTKIRAVSPINLVLQLIEIMVHILLSNINSVLGP